MKNLLAQAWPPENWAELTVLAAVSGGADSVALLRSLAGLKTAGAGRLVVGHLNHQLRGGESDADEQFVRRLAAQLGLECRVGRLDPGQLDATGDGIEAAARHERYRFLTATAEQVGARYVVCAHTADDQIETVLHRVLRGTGIGGLAGIPRSRRLSDAVTLIRPMLQIRRTELIEYLDSLGQPYCEDATNRDCRFTRNRLRHELLPKLAEEYNPAVGEALLRLGRLAGEAQGLIDQLVRRLVTDSVEPSSRGVLVRRDALADEPDYLARELLIHLWQTQGWPMRQMGFDEWTLLVQMLRGAPSPTNKRTFPGCVLAESCPEGLSLWREETAASGLANGLLRTTDDCIND